MQTQSQIWLYKRKKREAITQAIADVEKKHAGIFEQLKSNSQEMVRCMICNTRIIVLPERGSFMINVNKHIVKHTKDILDLLKTKAGIHGLILETQKIC